MKKRGEYFCNGECFEKHDDSKAAIDDGWGSDFMGDEEERKRLMGLPEREREEIIYDRHNSRRAALERRQALMDEDKQVRQQNAK